MPKRIPDEVRLALVGGPYVAPEAAIGAELRCRLRGRQTVAGYTEGGVIRWPKAEGTAGSGPIILCGDLVRALRVESAQAICAWFGLERKAVRRYRRLLDVPRYTEGTEALWRSWARVKLTAAARRKGGEAAAKLRRAAASAAAARPRRRRSGDSPGSAASKA